MKNAAIISPFVALLVVFSITMFKNNQLLQVISLVIGVGLLTYGFYLGRNKPSNNSDD